MDASNKQPIQLPPGISEQAFDVRSRLVNVPVLSELTARLSVLPVPSLSLLIDSEPAIYSRMLSDAREAGEYLAQLSEMFAKMADRLIEGGAK